MTSKFNSFGARDTFKSAGQDIGIFRLSTLQDKGLGQIDRLPYSIRV
jgi:aconitate hydratase